MKALRQGGARAAQAAHVPRAAPSPMALRHAPAGDNERTARRSTVHGACTPPKRCRWVAQGRSDGTTSARAGAAWRDRVLLGCPEGAKTRIDAASGHRQKTSPGQPSNLVTLAQARQNPPPQRLVTLGLRVGETLRWRWLDTTPPEGPVRTAHDRAQIRTEPAPRTSECIPGSRNPRRGP